MLWRLQLGLTQAGLEALTAAKADAAQSRDAQHAAALFGWLLPHLCKHPRDAGCGWDPAASVYRATKPTGWEEQLQQQPPGMKPQLRPYQRRAVQWMLERERQQLPKHMRAAEPAAAAAAAAEGEGDGRQASSSSSAEGGGLSGLLHVGLH
jgi:E3 ubiquitin-protein ligase SHPRH